MHHTGTHTATPFHLSFIITTAGLLKVSLGLDGVPQGTILACAQEFQCERGTTA